MWSPCAFALRDNNNLQQANRKLERKMKETKMQADEEHINLQSERDQVRYVARAQAIKVIRGGTCLHASQHATF